MKILIVLPSLSIGGGEIFALRLARALNSHHQVAVFDLRYPTSGQPLHSREYEGLNIYRFNIWYSHLMDNLVITFPFISLIYNAFTNYFRRKSLLKMISNFKPDIVNSQLIAADFLVSSIKEKMTAKWVFTMHGSYEQNLKHRQEKKRRAIQNAEGIVYIAEKNLKIFEALKVEGKHMIKIYNGFVKPELPAPLREEFRVRHRLPDSAFLFIMVARSDPRKGWEEAIQAFLSRQMEGAFLILVGKGEYMETLKTKYNVHPAVLFACEEETVFPAIANSHVGLLPSYYPTESLPNNITEYLAFDLPTIATDIGDIRAMLTSSEGMAGEIIGFKYGKANVEELSAAMVKVYSDHSYYTNLKSKCIKASKKFDMSHCVERYTSFFEEITGNEKP